MKEIIPNGTEVLIFRYIKNSNIKLNEISFIKRHVVSSKTSDDLTYQWKNSSTKTKKSFTL